MKLEHLKYFSDIEEGLSINTLSDMMHISQQGLSAAIQKLEMEMDCQLLERTGKGVYYTESGRELAYYTKMYLEKVREIKLKQHPVEGRIFLPITPCIIPGLMNRILGLYMRENPAVELNFTYSSSVEKCLEYILNGEAEIAIGFNLLAAREPVKDIVGYIEERGCSFISFRRMECYIECAQDFLPNQKTIYLQELSNYSLIANSYTEENVINTLLEKCRCTSRLIYEHNQDLYLARLSAREGYGMAIRNSRKPEHVDQLMQVILKDEIEIEYGYIVKQEAIHSPAVQRLVAMLLD